MTGQVYSALSTLCGCILIGDRGKPGNPKSGRQRNVFDRLSKLMIIGFLSVSILPIAARAQAPAAPKAPAAKDQGEFDIANAAAKETDPAKRLDLLHQWEQKYPDSDFKGQREVQIADTESKIAAKALAAGTSAADMDAAQKAAQDLLDNLDKYLAPGNKPDAIPAAQWTQIQQTMVVQAHMELAAVSASKKNDAVTE